MTSKLIVLVLLSLGLLVVCSKAAPGPELSAVQHRSSESPKPAEVQEVPNPCEGVTPVPWSTWSNRIEANEAKAEADWKGKCQQVFGVVASVSSGLGGSPTVNIGNGEDFEFNHLMCKPVDTQAALALSKGQRVFVVGMGGHEVMGSLALHDCVIVTKIPKP